MLPLLGTNQSVFLLLQFYPNQLPSVYQLADAGGGSYPAQFDSGGGPHANQCCVDGQAALRRNIAYIF